jgi:hypothetical protein
LIASLKKRKRKGGKGKEEGKGKGMRKVGNTISEMRKLARPIKAIPNL